MPVSAKKIRLADDYSEGAHPRILSAIVEANQSQELPYGNDTIAHAARREICRHLGTHDVDIQYVPSGTSANAICIAACLRPHEAVVAAKTAHIVVRETGAIEAKGHKIITVDTSPLTGKLTPELILGALAENWHYPHMAKPRMVYISQATEMGTVYSKSELEALKQCCVDNGLLLFLDGARLPAALASPMCQFTLADILRITDLFWIGGTKNGLLFGEAIVVKDPVLAADFKFFVKQSGCLLAKSWIMSVQFAALFGPGDLSAELARHANSMATLLAEGLAQMMGCSVVEPETNQVFATLPSHTVLLLQRRFDFYIWSKPSNDRWTVRLMTSWATSKANIQSFLAHIQLELQRHGQAGK
ncbi:beta-eliminating lyase [Myriangium duriaei CBS 260.36]|uniref:Beta-eliminating lyase n=1 Tax=Myriangium duriaei CBS 260.36 TaxID=1168546 RepID=A0A9P4ISJ6_9PEZI|nr:beta-eliminating lyase [Myriangium duriaei CBS 260.36]